MKKFYYYLILYISLVIIALIIFAVSGWNPIIINLIILNIILFILHRPLKNLSKLVFKKKIYRAIISVSINIIWGVFFFWLILMLSIDYFIAILSFLVVTISFTFRTLINNMASGVLMLTMERLEIGDLIETNGIQGIVKTINLNYTIIRGLDGANMTIPNNIILDSTLVKFTHVEFKTLDPLILKNLKKNGKEYRDYLKSLKELMRIKKRITKYIKPVYISGSIEPENLDKMLSPVFEKYQRIFGIRPYYSIDEISYRDLKIKLHVISELPQILVNNIDAFLRDLVFQLYSEEIYEGWENYKKKNKVLSLPYEVIKE